MLVHRRVTRRIKFASTHLYTWVERGTVRVKCLAQEHNTMSPARPRTRSTRSGVERANREATAPCTNALHNIKNKNREMNGYKLSIVISYLDLKTFHSSKRKRKNACLSQMSNLIQSNRTASPNK